MKQIKTIVSYSEKDGRFTIPREIRKLLKLENVNELELDIEKGIITITPVRDRCIFCNSKERLSRIGEYSICEKCLNELKVKYEQQDIQ